MPLFNYKAQDTKGKIITDTIQAAGKEEAAGIVTSMGLKVLTVRDLDSGLSRTIGGKISTSEKAAFCRFMATMLRAGLSLPESVEIIKQESRNSAMERVLADISFQTRKGNSLSAVLSQHKGHFDSVFLAIIKAGESAGTLDKSFDYLANQLTASYELSQKVKGSLMYPAVIVSAMLAVGVLMIVFVLPRISEVFSKMNIDLPIYTELLLRFGDFVGNNVFIVLALIVVFGVFIFAILTVETTRNFLFLLATKIPAVRHVVNDIDVARFARTLSTLLKSGVPIVDALTVSANSLSQAVLKKQAIQFGEGVSEGISLSDVLAKQHSVFPATMIQTIKAGEKTGTLDQVLAEMADFYEREVEHSLKRFTALLEPVIMLLIGVAVGGMVIMIIAPIYSVVGNLQSSVGPSQ